MDPNEESSEGAGVGLDFASSSGIRTFFVFLDLPKHVEFRVGSLPLLPEGLEVQFDLEVRVWVGPRKPRPIEGVYRVQKRIVRFSSIGSRSGLTQYLEWEPVRKPG